MAAGATSAPHRLVGVCGPERASVLGRLRWGRCGWYVGGMHIGAWATPLPLLPFCCGCVLGLCWRAFGPSCVAGARLPCGGKVLVLGLKGVGGP